MTYRDRKRLNSLTSSKISWYFISLLVCLDIDKGVQPIFDLLCLLKARILTTDSHKDGCCFWLFQSWTEGRWSFVTFIVLFPVCLRRNTYLCAFYDVDCYMCSFTSIKLTSESLEFPNIKVLFLSRCLVAIHVLSFSRSSVMGT